MAIVAMSRITIYGLRSQQEAVLKKLQHKGIIEPEANLLSSAQLVRADVSGELLELDQRLKRVQSALSSLDIYAPVKKKIVSSRKAASFSALDSVSVDRMNSRADQIQRMSQRIHQMELESEVLRGQIEALTPYRQLDISMDASVGKKTRSFSGTLSGVWESGQLEQRLEEYGADAVIFEVLQTDRMRTAVWLLYHHTQEEMIRRFLQETRFSPPVFSAVGQTALQCEEEIREALKRCTAETEAIRRQMLELAACRDQLELLYDCILMEKERYQAVATLGMTEKTFVMGGYLPQKYGHSLKKELEKEFMVYLMLSNPGPEEDVPVLFQNNIFTAPVESVTEMYSMPARTDLDPNPVMAFFYYLFFGMMFSDAGYGLLVMLACGVLGFGKRLEYSKRVRFRLFFFCGVSTTFWGLLYGSFFGDVLYVFSTTFLGRELKLQPVWIDPIENALTLLIFSISLGMLHILIGLSLRFYKLCRQRLLWDACFDVGFWILLLLGICGFAAGFGMKSAILSNVGIGLLFTGIAGLILTQGRKKKGILRKLLGGVVSLYNITGYVSDAMSYSRLMALGLATGVIGNVVNLLGALLGKSIAGGLLFAVVFLLGHSINFSINMLGAYVHTNRLQYVEFFSKFYEGGGRKFTPFLLDTHYYRFETEGDRI